MYNNLCNETARYILLNYFREFEYLCTHIYIYIFAVKSKRKVSKGLAVYSTIDGQLKQRVLSKDKSVDRNRFRLEIAIRRNPRKCSGVL